MIQSKLLVSGFLFLCLMVRPALAQTDLELVEALDLERYQGVWYEIARLPNEFQDQCVGDVTAEYTLLESGKVEVINRCRLEDGSIDQANGLARRPDPDRPAALEVRFAPRWLSLLPFVWGEYQVFALDDDYQWALVGDPSREYLWMLARTPRIDSALYQDLIEQAAAQGFDTQAIVNTEVRNNSTGEMQNDES